MNGEVGSVITNHPKRSDYKPSKARRAFSMSEVRKTMIPFGEEPLVAK